MFKMRNPYGNDILDCEIEYGEYAMGKTPEGDRRMFLSLICWEDGYKEPYCDITVNIPSEPLTDRNCAFVDMNNAPFLEDVLKEQRLADPTGEFAVSGYCIYPEYRFNRKELEGLRRVTR